MTDQLKLIIGITEDEYRGKSYNSPNFVETMNSLGLEEKKRRNREGYSPWSIFLHAAYWKWKLVKIIDPSNPLDFPFSKEDFPGVPGEGGEEDWQESLEAGNGIHREYIRLLGRISAAELDKHIKDWECTLGKAVAWAVTHDSYHTAQVRNMNLPEA